MSMPLMPFVFSATGGGSSTPGGPNSHKSGVIAGASFAGSPKKFAVVFSTPYTDDQYIVAVDGVDSRSFTYESKTAAGFTVNTNANTAPANEVSWFTTPIGET